MSESFEQWLSREMPAGTVIGDPLWWAPKIRKALQSGEPVVFTCHGNNAPAYGCNKPGDMSGTYYKAPQPVVPEGYRVERGSVTYNEILVTAPDGGQQTFWPDDAAYVLIKALLPAGKENNNAIK